MLAGSINAVANGLDRMSPLDMMGMPSITGGAAAPSTALAYGSTANVTMNNPFSFATKGAIASATADNSPPLDANVLFIMAIIGGVILIALK